MIRSAAGRRLSNISYMYSVSRPTDLKPTVCKRQAALIVVVDAVVVVAVVAAVVVVVTMYRG